MPSSAKTAKRGGTLHSAPDLVLVMADTGTQPMTTSEALEFFSSHTDDTNSPPSPETHQHNWLAPLPITEDIRRRCHTDVSQDPKYNYWGLSATESDAECTTSPRRVHDWVLPHGETQALFQAGHGTAPDLIYAREVPDSPPPRPDRIRHETMHSQ
jgi:hypothetical protein